MANLVKWLKDREHDVGGFVNQHVVQPIENATAPIVRDAQGAVAQVNPADGGRTFNTVTQKGPDFAPQVGSALNQVFHSEAANTAASIGKSTAQPFVTFGKSLYYTPQAISRELQNKPIDDIQQKAFGTTDQGKIARDIIGSTAGVGLTVAAPGISKGIEVGAARLGADALPNIIAKPAIGAVTGAALGGPINVASAATNNNAPFTPKSAGQAFKQGTIAGGALGATGGAVGAIAPPVLRAATSGIKSSAPVIKNAASFTPRVNVADQQTLRDFSDHLAGANTAQGQELSNLITNARQVGQKYGINLTTGSRAQRLERTNSVLDQIGQKNKQISQGGYAKIPGPSVPEDQPSLPQQPRIEMPNESVTSSSENIIDPLAAIKQEALKRGYTSDHYSEEGQIGNTIDSLMKDQTAYRDASVPLLDKYKDQLDGTKNIQDLMTPAEKKTLQVAEAKSTHATKLLKDYFNYKKQINEQPLNTGPYNQAPADVSASSPNELSSSTTMQPAGSRPLIKKSLQSPVGQPGKIEVPANQGVTGQNSLANSTTNSPVLPVEQVAGRVAKTKSTLPTNQNISPEIRRGLDKNYTTHSFTGQIQNAQDAVANDLPGATEAAIRLAGKNPGAMNDAEHQFVGAVAAAHDLSGTPEGQQIAAQLYNQMLAHRTATAQTFSAFRDIAKNNPGILKVQAKNYLNNNGIELTPAQEGSIDNLVGKVKSTKAGTLERDRAVHELVQFVHQQIPSSSGDKAVNLWRAGLLTSPITTGGNILGNTGEALVRNAWVNPLASMIDRAQSVVTGQRTKTLQGGQIQGAVQGIKDSANYLKTGFDPNNPLSKFETGGEVNYGKSPIGKAAGKYVNTVYRGLGAQDKPFRQAAQRQAAKDLAVADAKNLGLKGVEKESYINKAINDPSWEPQTFKTANDSKAAGAFAVFANQTGLGRFAAIAKQPFKVGDKTFDGGLRQFIMPFSQVPASIAMRIWHRSDFGGTEIVNQLLRVREGKPYDQRAVSEAVANGTFGPAAIGAGYALAKSGNITGNYPTDSKEKALWKSEGKQANSVKIGNRWYSLNYLQPFGTLLGIGAQAHKDEKDGKSPSEIIAGVAATAAKSVESQSFLQGINGLLGAINDPQQNLSTYINQVSSSVVPNIIKTTARATDPLQRDVQGPINAIKSAIPGVRESLPAKQDMFGNNMSATDNPLNQLFNPLRPNKANTSDPVVNELQRLQDSGNGIIPTQFNKNAIKGTKLSDEQVRQLNATVNPKVKAAWQGIISDPRYQALSDEDKATVLKRAKDNIAKGGKGEFALSNSLPVPKNSATSSSDYFSSSSSTKSPADKYKTALNNYNANKNSMSDVQRYAAEQNLAKLKVQAPFSNDVVSLYGMNKTKAYDFVSNNKNGKALANQLFAYDKALYDAGLTTSLKYKTGLGPSNKTSSKGSKGGKKGKAPSYDLASIEKSVIAKVKTGKPPKVTIPKTKVAKQPKLKSYTPKKVAVKKGKVSTRKGIA